MDVRTLDIENLQSEYGVLTQRLLPWPMLQAPFEGAWAVLEPGAATTPHAHHEHELFIATQGSATISAGEQVRPFKAGDTAYLPPGEVHQIVNVGDSQFRMYSVWWDPQLVARFSAETAERFSAETAERLSAETEARLGAENEFPAGVR